MKYLWLFVLIGCATAQDSLYFKPAQVKHVYDKPGLQWASGDTVEEYLEFIEPDTLVHKYRVLKEDTTSQYLSWQKTLEGSFDIVETFDQLQDWKGSQTGSIQTGLPIKLDSSASIWELYTYYGDSLGGDWIANHPEAWDGKSLYIDYDFPETIDKGPSRLEFSIGTQPSDGYPDSVFVFFMNKYNSAFFPTDSLGQLMYHGFLKTLQVSTGFRDVYDWGTVAEQASINQALQTANVYGLNFFVMNFYSNVDSWIKNNTFISDSALYTYETSSEEILYSTDIEGYILNDEWFGLEYKFTKTGVEVWIYDVDGSVSSHEALSCTAFNGPWNHAFNKFGWGGNRHYTLFAYGQNNCTESHMQIDDIIVNSERIGPNYFQLWNAR